MSRKLKSDKVLFLATLLLVCASVVMVYSASAVLATQRYNQPYYFLIRQGMWAALGLAAMSLAMRLDYRNYREPPFIWVGLGVVTLALVARLKPTAMGEGCSAPSREGKSAFSSRSTPAGPHRDRSTSAGAAISTRPARSARGRSSCFARRSSRPPTGGRSHSPS